MLKTITVFFRLGLPTSKFRELVVYINKKSVENCTPSSIPRTEALALPIKVEQTTSEPTPI